MREVSLDFSGTICSALKKRFYLFILERGREGEGEGEKHQCVVASYAPSMGDLASNRHVP